MTWKDLEGGERSLFRAPLQYLLELPDRNVKNILIQAMIRRKFEPGISWLKVQANSTKILLVRSRNIYFLCNLIQGTLNHSTVWQFISYPTLNAIDKETLSWIQPIIYLDEENRLSLPAAAFINMLDILGLIYEYAARHLTERK